MSQIRELKCRKYRLPIGERTLVMGIINVTPDSFSGDGLAGQLPAAVAQGKQMAAEGADILDVGGESTRPGAEPVSMEEEMARVLPVIEKLSSELEIPISVDTYKSQVARPALEAGASMVNDISGLRFDAEIASLAAEFGAGLVIMHIQGTPRDMQKDPQYQDLMGEITDWLRQGIEMALTAGVQRDQIMVDPGIGFGKAVQHNLEIIRRLGELRSLGQPILIGTSRKSTIGKVLDLSVEERLEGTAATVALSIQSGADMVRVHDVREMVRVTRMSDAIVRRP